MLLSCLTCELRLLRAVEAISQSSTLQLFLWKQAIAGGDHRHLHLGLHKQSP